MDRLKRTKWVAVIDYWALKEIYSLLWQRTRWNPTDVFFSFTQWKFSLPGTWWNFSFYPASLWCDFYVPSLCDFRTGQPAGTFADLVTFFPKTHPRPCSQISNWESCSGPNRWSSKRPGSAFATNISQLRTSWAGQFWQIAHTLSFQDIH